jgi:hypothetical protein
MGFVEKDYLLRYFNQLGVVLAKILGLKEMGKYEEAEEVIEQALTDSGLRRSDFYLAIDESCLIAELLELDTLNNDQINTLAELLFEKGEISRTLSNLDNSRKSYSKALVLFNYLTENEKVFSFDREQKIKKIKSILAS